jgi:hypothetical protein
MHIARSLWRAQVACVPRSWQRQSFLRTLLSQLRKSAESAQLAHVSKYSLMEALLRLCTVKVKHTWHSSQLTHVLPIAVVTLQCAVCFQLGLILFAHAGHHGKFREGSYVHSDQRSLETSQPCATGAHDVCSSAFNVDASGSVRMHLGLYLCNDYVLCSDPTAERLHRCCC